MSSHLAAAFKVLAFLRRRRHRPGFVERAVLRFIRRRLGSGAIYHDARVRCIVPRPETPEHLDIAFDHDGGTSRLRLPRAQAAWMVDVIKQDYLPKTCSHSPISSGSASLAGSPQDGQSV